MSHLDPATHPHQDLLPPIPEYVTNLRAYQETPYAPCEFYAATDFVSGDPADPRWRGYLRTSYDYPHPSARPFFTASPGRELGEWLASVLHLAGAMCDPSVPTSTASASSPPRPAREHLSVILGSGAEIYELEPPTVQEINDAIRQVRTRRNHHRHVEPDSPS